MCTSICSAGLVWYVPQMTCMLLCQCGGHCARRKRIKKATATADGEPIEDAANELEDSDAEDEGDASFIQSDEDELSGTLLFCVSLPLLANVTLNAETVLQPLSLAVPQIMRPLQSRAMLTATGGLRPWLAVYREAGGMAGAQRKLRLLHVV